MPFSTWLACLVAGAAAIENGGVDYDQFQKLVLEKTANSSFVGNSTELNARGKGMEFACTEDIGPSPTVPTSVHALRPGDIRVMAAIGDSITAAFGESSRSILDLFIEWRGRSWSIGQEFDLSRMVTVPAIMQKFNPDKRLVGVATGNGGANSNNAGFNVAQSGAIARGVPGQAQDLVNKMRADPNVDFEQDWKVVTLWIGGNDLCAVCNNRNDPIYQPQGYIDFVEEALDILRTQMPRTFVNLVSILEITQLNDVQNFFCVAGLVCRCGTSSNSESNAYTKAISEEYQRLTMALGDKPKWHEKDDFTVVVQPFFTETKIPRKSDGSADRSFFAPDCFHFSEAGHEGAAVALWNNMLEPYGNKSVEWVLGEDLKCPSAARPFLATSKN